MSHLICFELILLVTLAAVFYRSRRAGNRQTGLMSFEYTTVLRGIAILMVYLQHTMGALGTRVFTPLGGAE